MKTLRASCDSPLGPLTVVVADGALIALEWGAVAQPDQDPLLSNAMGQLQQYFAGSLRTFDMPLAPQVSDFQRRFGAVLQAIPFGYTRTYGQIGAEMGVPAQAVGQACGANPIPIIIPCHRVLAQCGLGGFSGAGGVEAKVALLRLESAAGLLI